MVEEGRCSAEEGERRRSHPIDLQRKEPGERARPSSIQLKLPASELKGIELEHGFRLIEVALSANSKAGSSGGDVTCDQVAN